MTRTGLFILSKKVFWIIPEFKKKIQEECGISVFRVLVFSRSLYKNNGRLNDDNITVMSIPAPHSLPAA